jgi:hypothetical protein
LPGELLLYRTTPLPEVEEAWRVTEAILAALARDARDAGSALAVLYVPRGERIRPEHWRATEERYGIARGEWSLEQVGDRLRAACARAGIDCIDPTEALAEADRTARAKGERLYFPQDGHWTARGNEVVGRILADSLARRGAF